MSNKGTIEEKVNVREIVKERFFGERAKRKGRKENTTARETQRKRGRVKEIFKDQHN